MKDTEQSDRSAVLDERRSAILERSNFDVSSHDEGDTPGRDSYSSDASGTFKVLSKLEKWGDYENYGAPVGPARFIPLKTPLTNEILQGRQFGSNFTLREFLDSQKALERKVGMIIDLSNHDCLYSQARRPLLGLRSDVFLLREQGVLYGLFTYAFYQKFAVQPLGFSREVAPKMFIPSARTSLP